MLQVLFTVAVVTGLVTGGIGGAIGVAVLFIGVAYGLDYLATQREAAEKLLKKPKGFVQKRSTRPTKNTGT